MKPTNTAAVKKTSDVQIVCVPGDEERGVPSTWHILGRSGRHPLDSRTFPTYRAAKMALDAT